MSRTTVPRFAHRISVCVSSSVPRWPSSPRSVRRSRGRSLPCGSRLCCSSFGARPHPPRELYRAYLAQSDIFVGLYWQRYGWIGPGMEISGPRTNSCSPRRCPACCTSNPRAGARGAAKRHDHPAPERGDGSYKSFRSSRELGRLVRDDLAMLLSERFVDRDGSVADTAPARSSDHPPPLPRCRPPLRR